MATSRARDLRRRSRNSCRPTTFWGSIRSASIENCIDRHGSLPAHRNPRSPPRAARQPVTPSRGQRRSPAPALTGNGQAASDHVNSGHYASRRGSTAGTDGAASKPCCFIIAVNQRRPPSLTPGSFRSLIPSGNGTGVPAPALSHDRIRACQPGVEGQINRTIRRRQ